MRRIRHKVDQITKTKYSEWLSELRDSMRCEFATNYDTLYLWPQASLKKKKKEGGKPVI